MTQNIPNPQQQEKTSFLSVFVQRFLVHVIGITIGFFLGNIANNNNIILISYLGFISLFPRGNWKKPDWFIPVAVGLVEMLVALAVHVPIGDALFFAGVQTWLQRMIQNKARLSIDWVIAPFFILCADSLHFGNSLALFAISFSSITLLGVIAQILYRRIKAEQIHTDLLQETIATLSSLTLNQSGYEALAAQVSMLRTQAQTLEKLLKGRIREGFQTIRKLSECAIYVKNHIDASKPSTKSGWSKALLHNQKANPSTCLKMLTETNSFLKEECKRLRGGSKNAASSEDFEGKLLSFEESAADLLQKESLLQQDLAKHVVSIANTTFEILKNMREDPADRDPGARFLDRYLPAVHKIIEEYTRLSAAPVQDDVKQALEKSADILARMDSVFTEELKNLLQNDAINFNAEVDAIDVMLKMKGH